MRLSGILVEWCFLREFAKLVEVGLGVVVNGSGF